MKPVDGRQLRAARAILGWTSERAAEAARIHRNSVTRTEAMETLTTRAWAADRLASVYEGMGVMFGTGDNGPAVSFKGPSYRSRPLRNGVHSRA
jgi:hypothetical protein